MIRNIIFSFCMMLTVFANPPLLIRSPYLQMPNSSEMTVRWRTDIAGTGVVKYGVDQSNLNLTSDTGASTTEHEIRLLGLNANTKYYYSVEVSSTVLASGASYYFYTAPEACASQPVRFWILGDAGTGSSSQINVRNAFAPVHAAQRANAILLLGDNAYDTGTDANHQTNLFDVYADYFKQLPVWSCIGNHETYSGTDANGKYVWEKVFTFPDAAQCGGVASGTERYYSWNYGKIHFVCLDSMTVSRANNGAMASWLTSDLQANTLPWIIAYFHHPLYTKGSHDSDEEIELIEMRENILPILECYNVDLVLSGHSHSYERSYFIDSHYGSSNTFSSANIKQIGSGRENETGAYHKLGTSPHEGAVYMVAGSSGQTSGGALNHPAHFISLNQLGSLILDVTAEKMDVKFLRDTGAGAAPVYDDSFTIIKDAASALITPDQLAALPLTSSSTLVKWRDRSVSEQSYQVYQSSDGINYNLAETLPANSNHTILTGVANSTYYCKITAVNSCENISSDTISYIQESSPPLVSDIEQWRFIYWSSVNNNDLIDSDSDGLVNLLEYAFGTSPINPLDAHVVTQSNFSDGRLQIAFPRQAIPDLNYIVEFSSDLTNWLETLNTQGSSNIAGNVTVIDPTTPASSKRFARIRVISQ